MKVIVFAVVGLLLGLGGGSGFAVMKARKAAVVAAADSAAKKDSMPVAKAKPDSASAGGREGSEVSTTTSATDSAPEVARAGTPALSTPSVQPPPAMAKPPASGDSTHAAAPPAAPGRIAKIFAAMSAKDAARVLQQLDDADIQTVLAGLNDKQAAAILAGFPPERAAAISRAVIRGKKGAS